MNNSFSAYKRSAYKKQSITTMTPMEIVVKLYIEIERQLNRAVHFIDTHDYYAANQALNKSEQIINSLRSVLDMKIDISHNLDSLYQYFVRQITTANLKKDKAIIQEILPMIGELRDAFAQVAVMPQNEIEAQRIRNENAAKNSALS